MKEGGGQSGRRRCDDRAEVREVKLLALKVEGVHEPAAGHLQKLEEAREQIAL